MTNYPASQSLLDNPIEVNDFLADLKSKPEDYWQNRGEKMALSLFHQMAKRVPAYKDFLDKKGFDPDSVKTVDDFKKIPATSKDNYLRAYKRADLCWDGKFNNGSWVISTTSGSTGEPFYFPRQALQDRQYALSAEAYLVSNFQIDQKSTLYIDGFAMGAWIGGLFTYQAIKIIMESGKYNLSIITPGIFKQEVIKAVRNLGHDFDQIIIGGYPPMVKDMIDQGIKDGLNWPDYNLGFIFSAEAFSEQFRDYIVKKTGLKDVYKDTLNHYGTVDIGTMAHETPVSILVRRLVQGKGQIAKEIFKEDYKQPTLAQFLPELFYFEEVEADLFCTSFSGIPLIRYDLKDYGGVISFKDLKSKLSQKGIDLESEIKRAGVNDTVWNLPFVYVYERKDFTVKLFGANIYPETIKHALLNGFENEVSGKFTMLINFDSKEDQYLEINVELKSGVLASPDLEEKIKHQIINYLLIENSEYKSNYKESQSRQVPRILLWEFEHPLHFGSGGKQKWVK